MYIGVKLINAEPMTRLEWCSHRGWDLPSDENGSDEGYKVTYIDGGYVSWSPKDVFDRAYRETSGLNFGLAIEALKMGEKVARKGWNGKGMWLIQVPASPNIKPVAGTPYSNAGLVEKVTIDSHIDMFTAQGSMQPGWLASQADMLADDWEVVD
jgi:hypothetical protein